MGQDAGHIDPLVLRCQCGQQILLLALHVGQFTQEVAGRLAGLFVLTAQPGEVGTQHLDLAIQVEHAALEDVDLFGEIGVLGLAGVELLRLLLVLLFDPIDPVAQIDDCLARFFVVEQAGIREQRRHQQGQDRGPGRAQEVGATQVEHVHQRSFSSARRFFAQAASLLPVAAGRSSP